MASAMPHGMLKAAAGRVSMPPSRPRCTIIGDRCPRNRDQDSDTAQDQQVAHTASSRDSQASSPFSFDQATGLPCKFNLNLESECFLLPMISGRSLLPRQPRSAQILTADSVQQQPIAAPEESEINHGIHRNTRKRESESTSPFRVLPGGGLTPAGWGAPPVGWGRSVVTRL